MKRRDFLGALAGVLGAPRAVAVAAVPRGGPLANLAPNTARALAPWSAAGAPFGSAARSDYSGVTMDASRKRVLFFGGGHGPGIWDDVRVFDITTLQWSSLYPPTPKEEMIDSNYDTTRARWISTNHPAARHTYNGMCVVGDRLYLMSTGGASHSAICWYDFADGKWHWSAIPALWSYFCGTVAVGRKVLVASNVSNWSGTWLYDTVTDSVIKLKATFGVVDSAAPSFVAANGKHYILTGDAVFEFTYNGADPMTSTCVKLDTTGAPPPKIYPSYSRDPASGRIGIVVKGNYHAFDPVTKSWTTTAVQIEAGSTGVPDTVFHCATTDPASGCLIALAQDRNTWAYRPPSF